MSQPSPAVEVAAEVTSTAAALSPWAALLLSSAKAIKAFVDSYAEARKIEALGFKAVAQEMADRMTARSAAASQSTPPAGS